MTPIYRAWQDELHSSRQSTLDEAHNECMSTLRHKRKIMQEQSNGDNRHAVRMVFSRPNIMRNALVALVVGSILNAINQGDTLWLGEALNWGKFILNYCVPFLVASLGSYNSLRLTATQEATDR